MKFSILALTTALGGLTSVLAQQPPANDECWNPIQITCGNTYSGSTTAANAAAYAINDCASAPSNNIGVWYKLSTGSDTFQVTLDTCNAANYDTFISVYTGPCTELSQDLSCVAGNDDHTGCFSWTSLLGPVSASGDQDYWIHVHGYDWSTGLSAPAIPVGDFQLTVTCDPVTLPDNGFDEDLLGSIDPWYIQRSAYPSPDVTNVDPLKGGTWVELHPDRVQSGAVPELTATVHAIPPVGQRCDQGRLIPGATFTATPCDPDTTSSCPELMNPPSVAVLQEFSIPDPYNQDIWITPSPGSNDGQFQFCVHTILQHDYDGDENLDEVSYFDTYYAVEVDYTTNFIQQVAALARNPGTMETIFDDWLVTPYLCADGNVPGIPINAATPVDGAHDYFVGETFRICITPDPAFENFEVFSFNDVSCSNSGDNRAVIVSGAVPGPEQALTVIDSNNPPPRGIAFESTVTSSFINPSNPYQYFECTGSVEMAPTRRRILQDGGDGDLALLPEDGNLTGSFKVTLTIVTPEPNGLSTGALVGIVMAAFAVFLVTLFIFYRRGCFDKKTNKPPKTVSVHEETSETSGDNSA